MHQEKAPTSQLGWHPGEPLSYTAKLKILLKKGEKICTSGGGLGQDPRNKKKKRKKKAD